MTSQLQIFAMARYPSAGSRVSLFALDALYRSNYCSLKLTEQVMKVERIVDNSQFGRGTTDAIFVVRQLQEKYVAASKRLHGFCRPGEGI